MFIKYESPRKRKPDDAHFEVMGISCVPVLPEPPVSDDFRPRYRPFLHEGRGRNASVAELVFCMTFVRPERKEIIQARLEGKDAQLRLNKRQRPRRDSPRHVEGSLASRHGNYYATYLANQWMSNRYIWDLLIRVEEHYDTHPWLQVPKRIVCLGRKTLCGIRKDWTDARVAHLQHLFALGLARELDERRHLGADEGSGPKKTEIFFQDSAYTHWDKIAVTYSLPLYESAGDRKISALDDPDAFQKIDTRTVLIALDI